MFSCDDLKIVMEDIQDQNTRIKRRYQQKLKATLTQQI